MKEPIVVVARYKFKEDQFIGIHYGFQEDIPEP